MGINEILIRTKSITTKFLSEKVLNRRETELKKRLDKLIENVEERREFKKSELSKFQYERYLRIFEFDKNHLINFILSDLHLLRKEFDLPSFKVKAENLLHRCLLDRDAMHNEYYQRVAVVNELERYLIDFLDAMDYIIGYEKYIMDKSILIDGNKITFKSLLRDESKYDNLIDLLKTHKFFNEDCKIIYKISATSGEPVIGELGDKCELFFWLRKKNIFKDKVSRKELYKVIVNEFSFKGSYNTMSDNVAKFNNFDLEEKKCLQDRFDFLTPLLEVND